MPLSKLSVVLQGSMLPVMAKWLHVIVPEKVRRKFPLDLELKENSKSELLEIDIPEYSKTVGRQIVQLDLPKNSLIVMIHREDKYVTPSGDTEIKAGDHLFILADSKESRKQIQKSFDIDHD